MLLKSKADGILANDKAEDGSEILRPNHLAGYSSSRADSIGYGLGCNSNDLRPPIMKLELRELEKDYYEYDRGDHFGPSLKPYFRACASREQWAARTT